ncbi:Transposase DDE domain group 1 [Rhizobiales bacterium GAS191]|nr:Transposase DDE domain group 1 [Rhizobiales bacterium GAS191]
MPRGLGRRGGCVLKLDFDRRLMLQFRGSAVTSDAGLLACRELDGALGLTAMAGEMLADARTGKNGRHALVEMLRQAVFGRLAGAPTNWELPKAIESDSLSVGEAVIRRMQDEVPSKLASIRQF